MVVFHRYGITLSAVVLSLVSAAAQVLPLPIQPVDVGYSSSLDRIVLIGKDPNQLVIFNPATAVSSAVALPKEPTSLSVSPDGRYAAVGFDALVSYINLTTGIIEKHLPVSTKPSSVLLTANGWVHAFPNRSIAIATGAETVLSGIWLPWKANLHPNGAWVYYSRGGSPDDLIKGDVGAGAFQYLYDSKYHGDFAICGGVWFTQDGQRLITGCGTVFRTSANQTEDLIYNGTFSATRTVQSAIHNTGLRRIALVPGRFPSYPYDPQPDTDTELQFYDDQFLTFLGRIALPELSAGVPWHGRHLFQDGAGAKLHVILQPDSKAGSAANWGVYTLSLGEGANCAATVSTTNAGVPAAGGSISVSVTAAAGCMWQATTTSNWLFVGTGGVGVGTSSVNITATANLQSTARTATVNIAGRTLTVAQAAPPSGTPDPVFTLPFRPVAAEYSKALDKIVVVTEAPHTLRIVDAVARREQTVALASTPKSLSLSPDGRYAAVGHDGWVSYVNLETTTLQKVIPVSADVFRLALSSTHIYVFPRRDQWSPVRVLNIATGAETTWNHIFAGETGGRISPDGRYLYINGTKRYDIRSGVPPSAFDAVSGLCFDMWFTEDGQRLLTRCGEVLRLSETPGQEIQYSGRLWEGLTESATHSSARKLIAALRSSVVFGANGTEDTAIHLFADDFISPRGTVAISQTAGGPLNGDDARPIRVLE